MIQTPTLDLFAELPVADYAAVRTCYDRLLGSPPTFYPHDTKAVWVEGGRIGTCTLCSSRTMPATLGTRSSSMTLMRSSR